MAKRPQSADGRSQRRATRPSRVGASKRRGTAGASRSSPGSPSASGPTPDAFGLFEEGIGALQRHHYASAADRFRTMLDLFPGERPLLDRARVYLDICVRATETAPQAPETAEEQITAATAALNNGDNETAERLARSVLRETPDHDLAMYLLAAAYARQGHSETALDWLSRALRVSPDVRAQALHDVDFEPLRELRAFQALFDEAPPPPDAPAQSGTVRSRQGRSER